MLNFLDLEGLQSLDRSLSLLINVGMAGSMMDFLMIALSSKWIWLVFVAIWLAFSRHHPQRYVLFGVAVFAVSCSDLFAFEVLKPYFGRIRPCKAYSFVRTVHSCGGMLSFPSNHATNAMTVAALIALWDRRRIAVPVLVFAVLVAFSRVYLGVHYLGDITFGMLVGLIWASILTLVIRKVPRLRGIRERLRKAPTSLQEKSEDPLPRAF